MSRKALLACFVFLTATTSLHSQAIAQYRPLGTLRDQAALQQQWLQYRLDSVMPMLMREQGVELADLALARIKAFPLIYVDTIDDELLRGAAAFKANYPISYADSFAAAMAVMHNAVLLTGNPEFKKLEKKEGLSIEWLRSE